MHQNGGSTSVISNWTSSAKIGQSDWFLGVHWSEWQSQIRNGWFLVQLAPSLNDVQKLVNLLA